MFQRKTYRKDTIHTTEFFEIIFSAQKHYEQGFRKLFFLYGNSSFQNRSPLRLDNFSNRDKLNLLMCLFFSGNFDNFETLQIHHT